MDNAALFFGSINLKPFHEVLQQVQEYMSGKYAALIGGNIAEQKQHVTSFIAKYLTDNQLGVEGFDFDSLVERLYSEMAEYSILTSYLFANDVEEININAWNDVKIHYASGVILPAYDHFQSASHAVDVVRRLLHKSGMILDLSKPVIRGHLSNKIRVTVFGPPVVDQERGVAASIRIINPAKLGRDDFIKGGTATPEMLDFLSHMLRYGVSMCVTGSTGSGKTTLMSWMMSTIPDHMRIVTIENGCREFDLVHADAGGSVCNNVVHLTTRESEDPAQNITQDKLLEFTLTANPDVICIGECKSAEAMAGQEAARTGHSVITTTHANSCSATYYRLVTLCRHKYDMDEGTLYNLVTEAFPIVLYAKRLEDNHRRIMEITECEILPDGTRRIHTLYRYHIRFIRQDDGKTVIDGEYVKENCISASLQKRLMENGMPADLMRAFLWEEEPA